MVLRFTVADKTDVGKQREQNEDSAYKRMLSSEEGTTGLFIVADGMGGYQAGEVASMLAVESISKALEIFFQPISEQPTIRLAPMEEAPTVKLNPAKAEEQKQQQKTVKLPETPIRRSVEERLTAAIKQANTAIIHYGEQKPAARGLGCTVTTVLVQDDKAYIANVGDSRTYLFRKGELKSLTKDHSLVAKLLEAKQIAPDEVYSHPQRNLIYRSLGAGHKNVEVDVFQETLQAGDVLLLCSDGLWEMVRDQDLKKQLQAVTESKSPQEVCDTLINMANANGGEDNITAIVVRVDAR
ncbi:MAG: Stp1/IreP family PP2C-type Ser/Thr phosphatase [Ktedonobacteraceae bacterium]|nr:Stp1/IreP family PP2C-type Ser/Thr phosphatase [Chloroflexota bacterium]